jgi:hypothetical protein
MVNPETNYRGYQIECDDEFGYIVKNGVRDLAEFGTKKEAKEFIDALVDDVHEARCLGY